MWERRGDGTAVPGLMGGWPTGRAYETVTTEAATRGRNATYREVAWQGSVLLTVHVQAASGSRWRSFDSACRRRSVMACTVTPAASASSASGRPNTRVRTIVPMVAAVT